MPFEPFSLIAAGFIGATVKSLCDWFLTTNAATRMRIMMFPPSDVSLKLVDDEHYVEIPGLCEAIRFALQIEWNGGMKLIGAPIGAGKTTIVLKRSIHSVSVLSTPKWFNSTY